MCRYRNANPVYEKHGAIVCRSPERPDLQLSMEEAYGRFAVDLIIGPTELLSSELRPIGKNVDNYASREERAHDKEMAKAKDRRKNARTVARANERFVTWTQSTLCTFEVHFWTVLRPAIRPV